MVELRELPRLIDAVVSDRLINLLLVSDADEVSVASPLYSATLPE